MQDWIDKEERMRMIDIVQSYDVMDSEQFHVAKHIVEELENNPEYELLLEEPQKSVENN